MLLNKNHILNAATKFSFEASLIGVPYANYVWMALVFYDSKKEKLEFRKNMAI